ncbi:MAG: hypothetical protein QOG79_3449 [Mycobacterium sp.]|jgi:hypothetical protein|nr:hypothetical protein [Mycobacterium sp.]
MPQTNIVGLFQAVVGLFTMVAVTVLDGPGSDGL